MSPLGRILVRSFCEMALVAAILSSCAPREPTPEVSLEEKLARVGLERISEQAARIPPIARGRYVPCRVIDGGSSRGPLPPHPAGYLLVGVTDLGDGTASATLEALAAWSPGKFLTLTVRRNHYHPRAVESEWWERDVKMFLPER